MGYLSKLHKVGKMRQERYLIATRFPQTFHSKLWVIIIANAPYCFGKRESNNDTYVVKKNSTCSMFKEREVLKNECFCLNQVGGFVQQLIAKALCLEFGPNK